MTVDINRKPIERSRFRSLLLTKYSVLRLYENGKTKEIWCVYLNGTSTGRKHIAASSWLKHHGFPTTNPKQFSTEEEASEYYIAMAGILMLADGPEEEVDYRGEIQKNPVA